MGNEIVKISRVQRKRFYHFIKCSSRTNAVMPCNVVGVVLQFHCCMAEGNSVFISVPSTLSMEIYSDRVTTSF